MTNNEYIALAMRTESPANPLKYEIGKADTDLPWSAKNNVYSRLLHSALGCADDAGELVKCIKDRLFYNKPIDIVNLKEEYGDLLWFIAQGIDAIGSSFEEVMEMNIRKLQARFPDKFTDAAAIKRDLEAEKAAMTQKIPAEDKPDGIWRGDKPTECQICRGPITDAFIDGKIDLGPWGIMCPKCHTNHGCGLGTGCGQLYTLRTRGFVKAQIEEPVTYTLSDIPTGAKIECPVEVYHAVMSGQATGEIVQIGDKFILRLRE